VDRLRVGVISDIHSNLPALEAVLEATEAARLDALWCLGDVVGYGAQPDECTALVRDRAAVTLTGNHDLAVLGALDITTFSESARAAVEWTRRNIAEESIEFLAGLQPDLSVDGFGLFHASPRDPIWEYVLSIEQAEAGLDAMNERIGLIGHSHVALFFTRPPSRGLAIYAHGSQAADAALVELGAGEWLLNPGSVGQPRDGDPRAAWLELDTEESTGRYHRVAYDVDAAAAAIVAAGLPTPLADRLRFGR
jgi:diadenosine tetraphosphatase ApaH/serine/threonine PP2A family protein phosphatase